MVLSFHLVKSYFQILILVTCVALVLVYYSWQRDNISTKPPNTKTLHAALRKSQKVASKKNVLFIMADDLRPQLNCYAGPYFPNPESKFKMHTPAIDQLASESILFRRAYVQMAICGPSRASLLTGRRPDTISNWLLNNNFRIADRNVTSLPQHFKQQGYHAEGVGKIFHRGTNWQNNDPVSWSVPWRGIAYESEINDRYGNWSWSAATATERAEYPLTDEVVLEQGVEALRRLAPGALSGEQPFFLGVGFLKPHLPWVFPEEFLKLYPLRDMDLPSTSNKYFPRNYPVNCVMSHGELTSYDDVRYDAAMDMNQVMSDSDMKVYRRAYFATVSFVDSLVGLLLAELKSLGLAESTVITFMGDHGWHLGENNIWGKYTDFEQATHTPLMLKVPDMDGGKVSDSVVEFVDVFQTITEAAGLDPVPACPPESGHVMLCTEGVSLLPLIDNPKMQVKDGAISQVFHHGSPPKMAYSLRTHRHRYTEWVPMRKEMINKKKNYHLLFDAVKEFELYDELMDPEENKNLADNSKYHDTMEKYSKQLHANIPSVMYDVKSPLF